MQNFGGKNEKRKTHVEELGPDVSREALGLHRSEDYWDIEDPAGLCQCDGVVLQHVAIDALHSKGHLRLMIDEYHSAVLGSEKSGVSFLMFLRLSHLRVNEIKGKLDETMINCFQLLS